MREMRKQACKPGALVEAGPKSFLTMMTLEAGQRGGERVTMQNCDAGERGGEQQKIDQYGNIVSAEIGSEC